MNDTKKGYKIGEERPQCLHLAKAIKKIMETSRGLPSKTEATECLRIDGGCSVRIVVECRKVLLIFSVKVLVSILITESIGQLRIDISPFDF